ncbi:hypothetical protein [Neochlamydia sp. AcF84]|uniref:hypothetical protein n=1 Tax=Neochlamydia sp. AcF84 TaxID=2315858 RepID=UPI00140A5B35|nr:hypothetical protein [Neochlamydia sp. AcF84]
MISGIPPRSLNDYANLTNLIEEKRKMDSESNENDPYDLGLDIKEHPAEENLNPLENPVPSGNPCVYSATCSCHRTCGGGCH